MIVLSFHQINWLTDRLIYGCGRSNESLSIHSACHLLKSNENDSDGGSLDDANTDPFHSDGECLQPLHDHDDESSSSSTDTNDTAFSEERRQTKTHLDVSLASGHI